MLRGGEARCMPQQPCQLPPARPRSPQTQHVRPTVTKPTCLNSSAETVQHTGAQERCPQLAKCCLLAVQLTGRCSSAIAALCAGLGWPGPRRCTSEVHLLFTVRTTGRCPGCACACMRAGLPEGSSPVHALQGVAKAFCLSLSLSAVSYLRAPRRRASTAMVAVELHA